MFASDMSAMIASGDIESGGTHPRREWILPIRVVGWVTAVGWNES
jgi:hypothetical protein